MTTTSHSAGEKLSGGNDGAIRLGQLADVNVYESSVRLSAVLSAEERERYMQHELTRFPVWLVIVLHYLTLGIFTFIYQGLKLSKLPLVREDDFRAAKGIGLCFVPFFNLYWVFRFVNAISDRLNFQLRLRGQSPQVPRGLGIAACVLSVIPFYTSIITLLVLMPILSGYMQAATNRLVDERARERAGLSPAPLDQAAIQKGTTTPAPLSTQEVIDQLERLTALKERGALSDADFEAQRQRVLPSQ